MDDTLSTLNVKIKKKKKHKSPLSKEYKDFLKNPNKKRNIKSPKKNIIIVKKKPNVKPTKMKPILLTEPIKPKEPPKPKESIKPKEPTKSRSKRRTKRVSKKLSSRRLHKKHLKNRRVSFRCYSKKNRKKVNDVMNQTKKMKPELLKQKLKEKGIEIKSNQNSLLRDMYLFTELGGIQIKKE
tara:strand:+ start:2188 stop:2733 length:546 start_codon:yes stop_codon:yes gene_type:complete